MPNKLVFNNIATQLLTQIYGTDGQNLHAIKTDSHGRLEIVGNLTAVVSEKVVEQKVKLVNASGTGTAITVDTSALSMYSFYIYNQGENPFKVWTQLAPVNQEAYFIDDDVGVYSVPGGAGTKLLIVPRHYLRFTRLYYEAFAGQINAEIWFNGRS